MRSDCDVERERRLDVVIRGDALVQAAMSELHRSPDRDAPFKDLHAIRQRPTVSVTAPKEEFVHWVSQAVQVNLLLSFFSIRSV